MQAITIRSLIDRTRNAWQMPVAAAERPTLVARWARDEADVRRAQRLRHDVFVTELGARPSMPAGTAPGLEADLFDPFCEHLLVTAGAGADAPVVGTYRVLTPDAARRAGGGAIDEAFDLTRLRRHLGPVAEIGRACVHPQWRDGATIRLLWSALAGFVSRNGLNDVVGSASVPMGDGGHAAADLYRQLWPAHGAPFEWEARPRLPLPVEVLGNGAIAAPPPLLKGYLRCGAQLLGAPAWDPAFGCADLPLLLRVSRMAPRYRQRLLPGQG